MLIPQGHVNSKSPQEAPGTGWLQKVERKKMSRIQTLPLSLFRSVDSYGLRGLQPCYGVATSAVQLGHTSQLTELSLSSFCGSEYGHLTVILPHDVVTVRVTKKAPLEVSLLLFCQGMHQSRQHDSL